MAHQAGVAPLYFINPQNNVNYLVAVEEPLEQLTSVSSLLSTPVTPASTGVTTGGAAASPSDIPHAPVQTLGNSATLSERVVPDEIDHYTVQRVLDVDANEDLRLKIIGEVRQALDDYRAAQEKLSATAAGVLAGHLRLHLRRCSGTIRCRPEYVRVCA